jgi:phosphoserine aminotransferase
MSDDLPDISIPADLLPGDGRFCSGPSKVRPEGLEALVATGQTYLGTSHRQAGVRFMVAHLRNLLAELFALPDGWEVVLGNGGTHAFWDAAIFGLIEEKSQHLAHGEFSSKFAKQVAAAPHLAAPSIIESDPTTHPEPVAEDGVDVYAQTHNETSTGVAFTPVRPAGAEGIVAVDATSAAAGLRWDPSQVDVYYFAPQKGLGSDGGLWIACCSPAALERIERISTSDRWIPGFLDLQAAVDNSRKDQTLNTPALATIFLAAHQAEWFCNNGGLEWSAGRCDRSAEIIYGWAESTAYTTPFVPDPAKRSHVVATIDLDESIDAPTVSNVLRANGVQDTESYRKLGRNQLRIATFPHVEPDDVAALTACVDFVVDAL